MKKFKNLILFVVGLMTILSAQSCATPNVACPKWTDNDSILINNNKTRYYEICD